LLSTTIAQAVKQLEGEVGFSEVENNDNNPLTDVEYDEVSKAMFGLIIAPHTCVVCYGAEKQFVL
jgi:hypothetical protein